MQPKERMVTIRLMGGLGNQLFQIFTLISHAIDTDAQFILPEFKLDTDRTDRPTYWDTILSKMKPFLTSQHPSWPQYAEPHFHYSPLPRFDSHNNLSLFGYYQSPKYFSSNYETIVNLLGLKEMRINVMKKYLVPIKLKTLKAGPMDLGIDQNAKRPCRCISMHFRIGDYKANPDAHLVIGEEHYTNALRMVLTTVGPEIKMSVCYTFASRKTKMLSSKQSLS